MAKIVIISGAGLSSESGIKTFRDSDGLWEEYDVMEVCSVEGFIKDRQKVMHFYDERRKDLETKNPNDAHKMIANLKEQYGDKISVLTQNVDDLLERAACKDVIHLHGTLTDLRCEDCSKVFPIAYENSRAKKCPKCESRKIRHNVVMFGEAAPQYAKMYDELQNSELLICIGTSGQVINVGYFADSFEYSILNNLYPEPSLDRHFKICYHEKATEAANKILKYCNDFMEGKVK